MRLWRLEVHRFRGIRELTWQPEPADRLVCLVGPCDSRKSTVLDAIALVASPRFTASFDDNDFYGADTSAALSIEATFGELPNTLMTEGRFGLDLGGVDELGVLHEEAGDLDATLTIRLTVDASLEPVWGVISARSPDGRRISAQDRARLAVVKLGDDPDRQFTWSRGSALARGTDEDAEQVPHILAAAYRQAREAVTNADVSGLGDALESARTAAAGMGAGDVTEELSVRLMVSPTSASGLALHSSGVPLAARGLGTRRLFALGLEVQAAPHGALVCLDEIEHGLEPHRIRHLIRALRDAVAGRGGQVICTTHSPVALEELGTEGVHVVHEADGALVCRRVPADLVNLTRGVPHAFLGRRVLVGEGKTEIGVVRGFEGAWKPTHEGKSLAYEGVTLVAGGGRIDAPAKALAFRRLGYDVLLLADSDEPISPDAAALESEDVRVVQWDGACSTEHRAAMDASQGAFAAMVGAAADLVGGADRVVESILETPTGKAGLERLNITKAECARDIDGLTAAGFSDEEVRGAFAEAARQAKPGWFKRMDTGEALGAVLAADDELLSRDFGTKMRAVAEWCFGDDAG